MTITPQALNAALQAENFSPTFVRILFDIIQNRKINTGPAQPATIDDGAISISSNYSYYSVDTEAAAASDNLDTISNANEGDLIFIKAANASRTVVIKDGTGNIKTNGSVDLSLDNTEDLAILHYDGAAWKADLWNIGA
jgi:hypothetical protein